MTKVCSRCGIEKELSMFYKRKATTKDGLAPACKLCCKNYIIKNEVTRRLKRKRYINSNLIKIWSSRTLSQHRLKHKVKISTKELMELANITTNCMFCNTELVWGNKISQKPNSPSLDRINNEDDLSMKNICIICYRCNATKGNRTLNEFIDYCSLISSNKALTKTLIESRKFSSEEHFTKRESRWASHTKINHAKKGIKVNITHAEILGLLKSSEVCLFCQNKFSDNFKDFSTYPSIERLDNELYLDISNVAIICRKCNITKGSRTLMEFFDYCDFIAEIFSIGASHAISSGSC